MIYTNDCPWNRQEEITTAGKTYLVDHEGHRYEFLQASGLAGGWYGRAERRCGLEDQTRWASDTTFLKLPVQAKESVALTFVSDVYHRPTEQPSFDFIGACVLVIWGHNSYGKQVPLPAWSFGLSIRNIEPR